MMLRRLLRSGHHVKFPSNPGPSVIANVPASGAQAGSTAANSKLNLALVGRGGQGGGPIGGLDCLPIDGYDENVF